MKDDLFQGRDPKRVAEDEETMMRCFPEIALYALLALVIAAIFGFI